MTRQYNCYKSIRCAFCPFRARPTIVAPRWIPAGLGARLKQGRMAATSPELGLTALSHVESCN